MYSQLLGGSTVLLPAWLTHTRTHGGLVATALPILNILSPSGRKAGIYNNIHIFTTTH